MKTKTRQELANDFDISRKTLYRWLKKAGIKLNGNALITPKELRLIYEVFGKPEPDPM